MALSVDNYFQYDFDSTAGPGAGSVLATLTVDDVSVLNHEINIVVDAFQTGVLGPADNLKLTINGVDTDPLPYPATNDVNHYVFPLYISWSSPSSYPVIEVKNISAALTTTYHVGLKVERIIF